MTVQEITDRAVRYLTMGVASARYKDFDAVTRWDTWHAASYRIYSFGAGHILIVPEEDKAVWVSPSYLSFIMAMHDSLHEAFAPAAPLPIIRYLVRPGSPRRVVLSRIRLTRSP